jgi:hypothetical protein
MNKYYAETVVNGRKLSLVLTEQQILDGVKAAINDSEFVCEKSPGTCWSSINPLDEEHDKEECSFWRKVFKICDCK